MVDDKDLEMSEMFDAQRRVDAAFAPSFEESLSNDVSSAIDMASGASLRSPVSWRNYGVAATAAVLLLVFGLAVVRFRDQSNADTAKNSKVHTTDFESINQTCDKLLATITNVNRSVMNESDVHRSDMQWPNATDSLISFNTLVFPYGSSN